MKTEQTLLAWAGALALAMSNGPAQAVEAGDMLLRAGLAQVAPNDDATPLTGLPSASVEVGSGTSLGINFTYMITDHWGVEVLGALPFAHDIDGTGAVSGTVIEIEHLPPTVTAIYNFAPAAKLRPYVGVGLNYTTFLDETGKGALAGADVSLDDSTGLAIEAGLDYDLDKNLFLNASLWYIDIETTADTGAVGTTDVSIDPWVLLMGAGWRF